jgi:hypothetical protein
MYKDNRGSLSTLVPVCHEDQARSFARTREDVPLIMQSDIASTTDRVTPNVQQIMFVHQRWQVKVSSIALFRNPTS